MEQPTRTDHVTDYLAELRPHLDDLDPSERAEVLDELADALREVAAENDRPLRDVLGPPADYVAAYRTSAGLTPRPAPRSKRLRAFAVSVGARVRAQPWWPRVHALAVLLRPAWWTLRGAVLVVLAGRLLGAFSWSDITDPLPFAAVTAGVAVSLAVGAGHGRGRGVRVLVLAGNVIAAVMALTLGNAAAAVRDEAWSAGYEARIQEDLSPYEMADAQLTMPNGEPVTNIHPYSRDGEPLRDVLLFDGAGQPLNVVPEGEQVIFSDNAETEIAIEYQRDAAGQPITNLYPMEQYVVEYDERGDASRRPRTAPTIVLPPSVRPDPTPAQDDSSPTQDPEPAVARAPAEEDPGTTVEAPPHPGGRAPDER